MSIKITYSKKSKNKLSINTVLFVNEKFNTSNLKKFITSTELTYINDLLKTSDLKKNIFVYELNSKKKIVLISIKNNFKNSDIENLGAEFYGRVNYGKNTEYFINSDSIQSKYDNFYWGSCAICHLFISRSFPNDYFRFCIHESNDSTSFYSHTDK